MSDRAANSPAVSAPEVVITGMGMLTSMGCGCAANAAGFKAGASALKPITAFDASRQAVHTAGEAALPAALPPHRLTPAEVRRLERAGIQLLHAAAEALSQAGVGAAPHPADLEIVLGTSAGAMAHGEGYFRMATGRDGGRRRPSLAVDYQIPVQAGLVARAFGLNAPTTVISNACASGANALGHAWQLIRSGRRSMVVAGGYDGLCQLVFAGFDSLKALSRTLPKPFDRDRDGLAMGEGAAVFVLETRAGAEARGAEILATLSGYGATTDVHHLTQPHPQGLAALAAMNAACAEAGVTPDTVDYINSHGTGTPLNDPAEAAAIAAWAGDAAASIAVSSTKGAVGHLLGGAGAVEAAICLLAMRDGFLPATAHVTHPDPALAFDLVTRPRPARVATALSNSFGFGGSNATLVFQSPQHSAPHRITAPPPVLAVTGAGAVSPAGWGLPALADFLARPGELPDTTLAPPPGALPALPGQRVRAVPRPVPDRSLAGHPRMRRTSPISLFAAAAALEALGPERTAAIQAGTLRAGVIYTLLNGSVSFCGRFYGEVLANPATASPIIFPETVFNAPASHLAALLGITGPSASLVGDAAQFPAAIETASLWLQLGQADLVLVVGAEEHDWLTATAASLLKLRVPLAEGAACLVIEPATPRAEGIHIAGLHTSHAVHALADRLPAAAAARAAVGMPPAGTLLVDDLCGDGHADAATAAAWADWNGPRLSPLRRLGHGLSASGAWQCAAAWHALDTGAADSAFVAVTGASQRAATLHLTIAR